MEIFLATSNPHKLREIGQILGQKVRAAPVNVVENGRTFEANAIKKVRAIKLKPGQIAIADDSGLTVNCLGGKPGVRSARYANPPTAENLCGKLLKAVSRKQLAGKKNRSAEFVCVIAVAYPGGRVKTVKGVCRGAIIHEMRGKHGFGYDPVFIPAGYKRTFAEMSAKMKNRLSHRARALRKVKALLKAN